MKIILTALSHPQDALFSGQINITTPRFSIGRGRDNDWVLNDAKRLVSKRHCIIEVINNGVHIIDESTNGLSVNSKPVGQARSRELKDGDEIEMGYYLFKVNISKERSFKNDYTSKTQTPVLNDMAQPSEDSVKRLLGEQGQDWINIKDLPKNKSKENLIPIGWDGPPVKDDDLIKKDIIEENSNQDFINQSQQTSTTQQVFDLPKPVIPEDWLDNSKPAEQVIPSPAVPKKIDAGEINIVAVSNLPIGDIGKKVSLPDNQPENPMATPRSENHLKRDYLDMLQAFCDGFELDVKHLENIDHLKFCHNIGRALSIAINELQDLQVSRRKAVAQLEIKHEDLNRTPWIFSLNGDNERQLKENVIGFLAESEPRDLEMMKIDFMQIHNALDNMSQTTLELIENLQQTLDPKTLERQTKGTSRLLNTTKKAALWDALIQNSGLFRKTGKKEITLDILSYFQKTLKEKDNN